MCAHTHTHLVASLHSHASGIQLLCPLPQHKLGGRGGREGQKGGGHIEEKRREKGEAEIHVSFSVCVCVCACACVCVRVCVCVCMSLLYTRATGILMGKAGMAIGLSTRLTEITADIRSVPSESSNISLVSCLRLFLQDHPQEPDHEEV